MAPKGFSRSGSSILIMLVRSPVASSEVMFCWVIMRSSDSKGPPPIILPEASSLRKSPQKPATIAASVATSATGPLRNVLNMTPRAITNTICSQMPK